MTQLLSSYVQGRWHTASDEGRPLYDAVTGDEVARISSAGVDMAGVLERIAKALRAIHDGPALPTSFPTFTLAVEYADRARAAGGSESRTGFTETSACPSIFLPSPARS